MAKFVARNEEAKVWTIGLVDENYQSITRSVVTPNGYTAKEWAVLLQNAIVKCGKFASEEGLKSAEKSLAAAVKKYADTSEEVENARIRFDNAQTCYEMWHAVKAGEETNHLAFMAVIGHGLVKFSYSLSMVEGRLYNACIKSARSQQAENNDPESTSKDLEAVKEYMIKALSECGITMQKISKKRATQLVFEVGEKIVRKGAGFTASETRGTKFLNIWSKYVLYLAGVQMIEEVKPKKATLSF